MKKQLPIIIFLLALMVAFPLYAQVTEEWVARFGGSDASSGGVKIARDSAGNIYVTGTYFQDGSYNFATLKYNSNGVQQWVRFYNGPGNAEDRAHDIGVDGSGNIYVTGASWNGYNYDYATIKYDSLGIQQWVSTYNGQSNGHDHPIALALDIFGNIYVTGGSLNGSNFDFATVKYNSLGEPQWVRHYNGPFNEYDSAQDIVIDDWGNVYVTGYAMGIGDNFDDYATVKYDSSGNELWARIYNGPDNLADEPRSMAVDGSGNVYVTGMSTGIASTHDYATVKYNSTGEEQWVSRYNGQANREDVANVLTLDGSGNVYVTGYSYNIGGSDSDIATIKYDSTGIQQWVSLFDGSENTHDGSWAMAMDESGNIYLTGQSRVGSVGSGVTVKYDQAGAKVWDVWYNGATYSTFTAIDLDEMGNVIVSGFSSNPSEFVIIKYNQMAARFRLGHSCVGSPTEFEDLSTSFSPSTEYAWDFDGDGVTDATTAGNVSHTFETPGDYTARLTITDSSSSDSYTQDVRVREMPSAMIKGDAQICLGESSDLQINLTGLGPWVFGYTDGKDTLTINADSTPWLIPVQPYTTTVYTLTGVSSGNCTGAYSGSATVRADTAPVIGDKLQASGDLLDQGKSVSLSDLVYDYHLDSAVWHWSDGLVSPGTLIFDPSTGAFLVGGERTFDNPGTYTVELRVADLCGSVASHSYQHIFKVNGSGRGMAIGGGSIYSPQGAFTADASLTGSARFFFSFHNHYKNNPIGSVLFRFGRANMNFWSYNLEWMNIEGASLQLRGEGRINGRGRYGFFLSLVDEAPRDRFRIKIWDHYSGLVVYDNETGSPEEAEPGRDLAWGGIAVYPRIAGPDFRLEIPETEAAFPHRETEERSGRQIRTYPNPIGDVLFIDMESDYTETVSLSIHDMAGRTLHEESATIHKGPNRLIMDARDWNAHTQQLLFRLMSPSRGFHQKILLKK